MRFPLQTLFYFDEEANESFVFVLESRIKLFNLPVNKKVTSHDPSFQFRNQYDSDVTVWSPQGRIHQVEYAMEAVKLGSATVGLKSKDYAVLIALKRATSELSAHQQKILRVDDHIGISMAGITADARILWYYISFENLRIFLEQSLFSAAICARSASIISTRMAATIQSVA